MHQVVEGKPQRPPPVGVPAEHGRGGLGRFVVDGGPDALDVQFVGVVPVVGRDGPQTVGGQELGLVEELGEDPLQAVDADHPEQQPPVARAPLATSPAPASLSPSSRPWRRSRRGNCLATTRLVDQHLLVDHCRRPAWG